MNIESLITIDPEILGGQPVFKGTRVPFESLAMPPLQFGAIVMRKE